MENKSKLGWENYMYNVYTLYMCVCVYLTTLDKVNLGLFRTSLLKVFGCIGFHKKVCRNISFLN